MFHTLKIEKKFLKIKHKKEIYMEKISYYIYQTLNIIVFLIGVGTLGVLIKEKFILLIIAAIYTYLGLISEDYKKKRIMQKK